MILAHNYNYTKQKKSFFANIPNKSTQFDTFLRYLNNTSKKIGTNYFVPNTSFRELLTSS